MIGLPPGQREIELHSGMHVDLDAIRAAVERDVPGLEAALRAEVGRSNA
jgi:hypothetical protein